MKLLDRVKASLKHKHYWMQDQWGERCLYCGRVRTNKSKQTDLKLTKVFRHVFDVVYFALAISILILVLWKGIDEDSIRKALIVLDTNTYWVFLYIFFLLSMGMLKHLVLEKVET